MKYARIAVPLALIVLALAVHAEKADMPPEGLRRTATHVVVGEVKAIYTRESREGKWRYTRYVAEVSVEKVEKGEGLAKGALVYARYWTRRWIARSAPPPSTSGHRGLPKEGETLRIYLARNAYDGFTNDNKDGGFNVIGANGFERLK
jgi:hypothetical protein